MTTYKLSLSDAQAEKLADYLSGDVAEQIRAQIPKPVIEEPKQFGSIVRARADHFSWDGQDPVMWLYDGECWRAEGSEWGSVWRGLRDVEVLRVGLGDEPKYPHPDGDVTVLGPETFEAPDGSVISHKGENYYPTNVVITSSDVFQDDPYLLGMKDAVYKMHGRLQLMIAEAITFERKNALEKAIQAVEELAP